MTRLRHLCDRVAAAARGFAVSPRGLGPVLRLRVARPALALPAAVLLGAGVGRVLDHVGLVPHVPETGATLLVAAFVVGLTIGRILSGAGGGPRK